MTEQPNAESPITPEAANAGMRRAVMAQCFGLPLHFCLASGGLATLYADKFGASDLTVGAINGCLWVGFFLAVFVPPLIDRHNKRRVMVTAMAFGVIVASPLILLPWLPSANFALAVMALSALLYSLSEGFRSAAWFPALMDFVPANQVGHFFGRLRSTWQVVVLFLYIGSALALGTSAPMERFQIILAVLVAGALIRIRLVSRFPQRPLDTRPSLNLRERMSTVWRDRTYLRYLVFSSTAMLFMSCLSPSMVLFMRRCGYTPRATMIVVATGMLSAAVCLHVWGRVADRCGAGRTYRLGFILVCAALLLWLPASYAIWAHGARGLGYALLLASMALYNGGISSLGIGLTHHGFRLTPRDRVTTYLSILPSINQAAISVGMFLVGIVLHFLHASETSTWWNAYTGLFTFCAAAALVLHRFVSWVPRSDEPA